jgi:hypothetical protein
MTIIKGSGQLKQSKSSIEKKDKNGTVLTDPN